MNETKVLEIESLLKSVKSVNFFPHLGNTRFLNKKLGSGHSTKNFLVLVHSSKNLTRNFVYFN